MEHWNPETGNVNTTNVNFPWAASCMAGSIWEELTDKEQNEYLKMFPSTQYTQKKPLNSKSIYLGQKSQTP